MLITIKIDIFSNTFLHTYACIQFLKHNWVSSHRPDTLKSLKYQEKKIHSYKEATLRTIG